MSKEKKALSPGLLKYQAEQRAKKEAALQAGGISAGPKDGSEKEEVSPETKAKAEAEEAANEAIAAGAIKCSRCGLVFEKSAARTVENFGGRLGCPSCGFPIPQK